MPLFDVLNDTVWARKELYFFQIKVIYFFMLKKVIILGKQYVFIIMCVLISIYYKYVLHGYNINYVIHT